MDAHDHDELCPELCDYIIDFLHDDQAALRACALVCRSWVSASRCHLFYCVKLSGGTSIDNGAQDTACHRIFGTILSSPHIASYIKKLTIVEPNVILPSTYRWVSEEIIFPSLLKKLACLRALEFNFPPPSPDNNKQTTWPTMVSWDIRLAVTQMTLESFSLRQFLFTSLLDFVEMIFRCRPLKTLKLDHVDIATAIHFNSSAVDIIISLQSAGQNSAEKASLENLLLRSNNSYLIIPALLHTFSHLNLSGLRSLIMNVTSDGYDAVLQLIKHTLTLESLELEINPDFDYDAHLDHKQIINLSYLPSLKSFSLQSSFLPGRTEPLSWLIATLSTSTLSNRFEDFSLTCIVDKPPPSLTIQAFDNILVGWRNLDDLLTQPTFALMSRFRLDFAVDNPIGDESVWFISEEFVKQLQGLRSKGILEVDICELR